MVNIDQS